MSFKTIGVKLDGIPTDIVIGNFSNCLFIVLTQVKKFGSVLSVRPEAFKTAEGQEQVYNIRQTHLNEKLVFCALRKQKWINGDSKESRLRTLLGVEKENTFVAARYLAEQLQITKPVIFAISLQDDSIRVLRSIRQVILENKIW